MFNRKVFQSHADKTLTWKIECDDLTDQDLETFTYIIHSAFKFHRVIGIPNGGLRLAAKLRRHESPKARTLLIVDDVFTTGKSMNAARAELVRDGADTRTIRGLVLFARQEWPDWIIPVFSYHLWIP